MWALASPKTNQYEHSNDKVLVKISHNRLPSSLDLNKTKAIWPSMFGIVPFDFCLCSDLVNFANCRVIRKLSQELSSIASLSYSDIHSIQFYILELLDKSLLLSVLDQLQFMRSIILFALCH